MNIMYGNNHVGFGDAIFISIVSMAIVFLVLILISFLLSLLKFIPTEKNTVSKENKKTVEGVFACKVVYEEAKKRNISMPITNEVYAVLYEGKAPLDAMRDLMARDLKAE